jgi:HK97 family phage major capsid protein
MDTGENSMNTMAEGVENTAAEALAEQLAQGLAKAMERKLEEVGRARSLSAKGARAAIFGDGGGGDERRNFADFLLSVRTLDNRRLEDVYRSSKAALTTQGGAQGGYLVPEEFLPRLLGVAAERAIARPRATVIPMGSGTLHVPALDVTAVPAAGDTAAFGGLVARWSEEAAAVNPTEPAFRQITLTARELSGYAKVSNTLVDDAGAGLEALLVALFGGAIAWHEDSAFLRGDGVGKPLGAIGPATGAAVAVTRKTLNRFVLDDAAKMLARFMPGWSPSRACWVMHPSVYSELLLMSDATNLVFLPDARGQAPGQFFGLPVLTSEKLPGLGLGRDVCLVNWEQYLIGDRRQVEVAYSEHTAFTTNQAAWRFVARVDGQPWMRAPLTLSDGTSTLSPFVYLS